ncbi:MAG TPA: hydantoinase B/oxoprolinase family protein [Thermomicrobiales bacterium]|nr:hydantoinase B/oxoprolinase family protein [Thermomicrobiales bacterium]
MTAQETRLDPISLEVMWNRLIAVVNEQATALMRTSFTTIVRESGDLSAGVFDLRGNMIAQAVTGTPGHINAMATCIHHFLAVYPADTLRPGDVLITNDPQKTSGHLHDFTVITPIFQGQRIAGFFGNTCHVLDIGGRGLGTDANSVFEEGLFVPITKLYDAGVANTELMKLIAANVRTPEPVLGDIHAQVAGNDVGGRRLLDFMAEFGLESLEPLADEIIERSERAMRAAIARLPDGVFEHVVYSDGYEEPVRLQARIVKRGDEMWVDWAGSSPESARGINVVLNYTHAYTTYALKCALAPEVPNNEGSFRPVHVDAPPGCILNAQHPAPVGARHIIGHFLPGAIFGALAAALPDRVMAEGAANIWINQVSGRNDDNGIWTYVWFSAGGTGARPNKDGISATAFPSGISGVPAEVIESLSPIVMHRREYRADSGGAGTFRGGLGQVMEISVRGDRPFSLSPLFDRTRFAAQGYAGGGAGALGSIETSAGETLDRKGVRHFPAGTRVTLRLPGGGGFGPAVQRDPAAVLDDVRNELVTREAARRDYGVIIDDRARKVDAEGTEAERRGRRDA